MHFLQADSFGGLEVLVRVLVRFVVQSIAFTGRTAAETAHFLAASLA